MTKQTHSIAAMCLMEQYNETAEGTYPQLDYIKLNYGVYALRQCLADIAVEVDQAWNMLNDTIELDMPFDWEFVPLVMGACIDGPKKGCAQPVIRLDHGALARTFTAE
jgi:hypothetical protein